MSSISHGTPPALSQNPVSTPAEEWADKTTSALGTGSTSEPVASSGVAHNIESTSTSPGTEVPGAYPQDAHPRSTGTTSYAHSAGQVAHDAKGVAQGVADDVTHAIQSAGHTAAQYLPKGVVAAISPYLRKFIDSIENSPVGPDPNLLQLEAELWQLLSMIILM